MVAFEAQTFDEIRMLAMADQVPFSQKVRELVEIGLIELEDNKP
jgi:hypothetical protein